MLDLAAATPSPGRSVSSSTTLEKVADEKPAMVDRRALTIAHPAYKYAEAFAWLTVKFRANHGNEAVNFGYIRGGGAREYALEFVLGKEVRKKLRPLLPNGHKGYSLTRLLLNLQEANVARLRTTSRASAPPRHAPHPLSFAAVHPRAAQGVHVDAGRHAPAAQPARPSVGGPGGSGQQRG